MSYRNIIFTNIDRRDMAQNYRLMTHQSLLSPCHCCNSAAETSQRSILLVHFQLDIILASKPSIKIINHHTYTIAKRHQVFTQKDKQDLQIPFNYQREKEGLLLQGGRQEFKSGGAYPCNIYILRTVFDEILTSNYLEIAFIFGLQTLQSIDLGRIYCLKGLEPKNKGYFQIDGCQNFVKNGP